MKTESFPMERIPEGSKHLYGSLFVVPFASIQTPDVVESDGEDYKFSNPRTLTEGGQADLLDKRLSAELRDSIKHKTLLNPLVCRWIQDGEDFYPQVIGGDRRYRSLDYLIKKKEEVTDPRNVRLGDDGEWIYGKCSASEAYEFVPCQIFSCNDDLEALALSWAENKGRINLTEGHEVAEVIKLREFGATDDKILEILQQDEKWLAETDTLINELDENTLSDLLEGRVDRASAKALQTIEDEEIREKVRIVANETAQQKSDRKIAKFQKQVESALTEKEIAEGDVAAAEFHKDDDGVAAAKENVAAAAKKVKKAVKQRDEQQPVTTATNVKAAKAEVTGEEDGRPRSLRSAQIKEGLTYLTDLIKSNGRCPEGTFIANVTHIEQLKLVSKIIKNNILGADPDFAATVRKHVKKVEEIPEDDE